MITRSSRVRVVHGRNRVRIVIPAARERGRILALTLTVVMLTIGTCAAVPAAVSGGDPSVRITTIIFVFLCLAGYSALLWAGFGREVITADPELMTVSQLLFGIGPKRRYDVQAITDLHVCSNELDSEEDGGPLTRGTGQIEFTWRGRTRRFGLRTPSADAELVVEALAPFVTIRDSHVGPETAPGIELPLPEVATGEIVLRPKFTFLSPLGALATLAMGAFMVSTAIPELTTFHYNPLAGLFFEAFFVFVLWLIARVWVGALWTMMGRERIAVDRGSSLRLTRSIANISFSTTYRRNAITEVRPSSKESAIVTFTYGGLNIPVGLGADPRMAAFLIRQIEALLPPEQERREPDVADVEARTRVRLLAWMFLSAAAVKLAGITEAYKVVNPWFTAEQAKDTQYVAMMFAVAHAHATTIFYWCAGGLVLALPIAIGLAYRMRWAFYFAGAYALADAVAVFFVPWGGVARAASAIIAAIVLWALHRARVVGAFDTADVEL